MRQKPAREALIKHLQDMLHNKAHTINAMRVTDDSQHQEMYRLEMTLQDAAITQTLRALGVNPLSAESPLSLTTDDLTRLIAEAKPKDNET